MLKFIRKFFEKEVEKVDLDLDALLEWFNERTSAFATNLDLKSDFLELKEFLRKLEQDTQNLENAEMKDEEKIQSKVKQVVLGHRKSYIIVINNFINSIELPEKSGFQEGLAISKEIQEKLDNIGKTTIKSYYAVQHLFSNELSDVAKDFKQLDKLTKQIGEKIDKSKVADIDQVKKDVTDLIYNIKVKKEMAVQLREKGKELLNLNNTKLELENKTIETKEGNAFAELEDLKKSLADSYNSIKQEEKEIIELFSPLESTLKKYQRIAIDNWDLIEQYADSAIDTLFKDKELKIIIILEGMKQNILSDSLELRDEKKSKALRAIEPITKERLQKIISAHQEAVAKKESVESNIKLNSARSSITEIEYKMEHTLYKIKKLNEDIEIHQKKYDKMDISSLKKELENKINDILNLELTIN